MADVAEAAGSGQACCVAVRHFLAAVHQAIALPAPRRASDELPYFRLLDQRAGLARAAIGRLMADAASGELDYISEGDHILHQIGDLPPDTYRHRPGQP